jgi:hypothetical protein
MIGPRQAGDRYTLTKQTPRLAAVASEMGQNRPTAVQKQVGQISRPTFRTIRKSGYARLANSTVPMNIFLAHASEDKGNADSIAFSLRSRGYKVFLDRDDLPAGKSYDQQIGQAVQASDIFIFLISPDSVAEGRYTLTELTFARRKWNTPNGRVLPVMVRKTPLEQVPAYLKAVTILEPLGNITAETSAAVDDMRRGSRAPAMAWRFAAELIFQYRYILAVGAFCGCAGIFVVYAFNINKKQDNYNKTPERSDTAQEVAPVDCKDEPRLRSLVAGVATSIVFTNKGEKTIRLYWLDYDGKRTPYGTLTRNQVLSVQTYPTHPWVVTDIKDEYKAIYMPAPQRLEIAVVI